MEGYSGSDSYRIVEPLLGGPSRKIMVLSPYIDAFYASRLLAIARRKEVLFLTTRSQVNMEALRMLSRPRYGLMPKAIAYLAILLSIAVILRLWYAVAILSVPLALSLLRLYLIRKNHGLPSNMKVRLARGRFVHEKIYISEDEAVVGSANLTYNGMHVNIEHIERITDQKRVAELRAHFASLWRDPKKSKNLPYF